MFHRMDDNQEEFSLPRIQRLDPDIVKKIAAGEVIHQPFNVVKELIENSLDAKSTHIIVTLKDGGFNEIMIRDNGCGIHPDDTDQIANRFHSSKLKSVEDVYKIKTLGFRGEALSSMALIGKVTIVSKQNGNETGIRVVVKGNERTKQVEHLLDNGTTIMVSDLFKDYSPSDVKRSTYVITKLVTDYAFANPGIKFILLNPSTVFRTPNLSTTNQKEWISAILETKKLFLKEVNSKNPPFSVSIYGIQLKEAKLTLKAPKTSLTCFVNRRLVTICSLEGLFRDQLERNAFTCETIIAFFEIDPSLIDVHVSPTKEFVTMRNTETVLEIVSDAWGQMIKSRFEESKVEGSKSPRMALPSASNESAGSGFNPSQKIRFDPNQSLMDSFIDSEVLFEESLVAEQFEKTADADDDPLVFRRLEPLYDPLLKEIQEKCDYEWTNKFRTAQSMKLGKVDDLIILMFQYHTEFYFIPFQTVLEDFFYQRMIVGFGNFGCIKDMNDTKISLKTLISTLLPDTSEEFIQYKIKVLMDSKIALDDYFSVTFEETDAKDDVILTGVPSLHPSLSTPWSEVALALISFHESYPQNQNHNEEAKLEWVKDFALRLSSAFAAPLFHVVNTDEEMSTFEFWSFKILPAIKSIYLCGQRFQDSLISGSNNDLYKFFDRC